MSNKTESGTGIKWLCDKDLAARYGVSRISIWRWARDGKIPKPRKIAANTSRWLASEIDEHDQKIIDA